MSNVVIYDEQLLKHQFIEAYYVRDKNTSPDKIMIQIRAPKRMLTEWITDPGFQRELEKIDSERAWLAKEVIYRNLEPIFKNLADIAGTKGLGAVKAAELMLKIAGVIKTTGGGGGSGAQVTVNNNTVIENLPKGLSIEELIGKRDEVARLLTRLSAEPAEFTEEVGGDRPRDQGGDSPRALPD